MKLSFNGEAFVKGCCYVQASGILVIVFIGVQEWVFKIYRTHCNFNLSRLRVRIKALQQTIDTQSARITDLISSQVLASVDGMEICSI